MVPKQRVETRRPVSPSVLYCMEMSFSREDRRDGDWMAQRKGVIQAQREREEPPIFKWVLSSEMATISGVFSGAAFLSLNFLLGLKERPLGSSRRALFHS